MQNQDSNWLPLQSNPEVINPMIRKLGLKTEEYSFQQMLSIQDWALGLIPRPCLGIMLLYQYTPAQAAFTKQQAEHLDPSQVPSDMFYMKQYAQNACGTIALFHIIINALKTYPDIVQEGSYIKNFTVKSQNNKPEQVGLTFQKCHQIKIQHKEASQQGQSAVQYDTNSHFVSFIEFNGCLWQLDGLKKCPINHGPIDAEQFIVKGCEQIKKYMDRDPDNIKFSMIVLAKSYEI